MGNERSLAIQGQKVSLQIQFFDADGDKVDADKTPYIAIRDTEGDTILESTKKNVSRLDVGLYEYLFRVPEDAEQGTWMDDWTAIFDKTEFTSTQFFSVISPVEGLTATEGPAKIKLGDDVVFDFTQEELKGINVLLKLLKLRLRSHGISPVRDEFGKILTDGYGEIITKECNVFDDDVLVGMLISALSEFNSTPFFTTYRFSDELVYIMFSQPIVEIAYIFAVAGQALIEKGRDFTISDGGINYQAPQLGDFIQSHFSTWLTASRERIKFIKNSIRPGPVSFGTYSNLSSGAPAFTRLRHLRARRIF